MPKEFCQRPTDTIRLWDQAEWEVYQDSPAWLDFDGFDSVKVLVCGFDSGRVKILFPNGNKANVSAKRLWMRPR